MPMTRILSLLALVLACAAVALNLNAHKPSAGVTSCAQIAHDYVVQVAKANGLHIDAYQLQACHQTDPNHSVARVHVVVSPEGFPKGVLVQDVTIVYHLTRSAWQISDVHPVG